MKARGTPRWYGVAWGVPLVVAVGMPLLLTLAGCGKYLARVEEKEMLRLQCEGIEAEILAYNVYLKDAKNRLRAAKKEQSIFRILPLVPDSPQVLEEKARIEDLKKTIGERKAELAPLKAKLWGFSVLGAMKLVAKLAILAVLFFFVVIAFL